MIPPVSVTVEDGIAVVTIANPPVNALSQAVRQGLVDAVRQTDADANVRAVVLICDGSTFIAGADIREFGKPPLDPILPEVVATLESAAKPWVAAIHGTALGGGLEVALGCHYRIATGSAKLGLPEVNLGLIPGAGGTIRLPRCIAMKTALDIITSGKPVPAAQALDHDLLDAIASGDLREDAIAFARDAAARPLPAPLSARPVVAPLSDADADAYLTGVKSKARGQMSPIVAAETVIAGASTSAEDGLAKERANFIKLQASDQSKALRHIFFAERSVTKIPGLKGVQSRPHEVVGVIGGGTMGAGITAALLLSGLQAILIERDNDALEAGLARVRATLDASLKRSVIDERRHAAITANLAGSTDYAALASADMVIEAVFEDMDVKKAVFAKLDEAVRAEAILASNTSYLDVNELARSTRHPNRVLGLHFFSPAHIMKLVEVIRTDAADDDVIATTLSLAKKLRKLPVPAGVCDGFIGNRVMSAYRRAGEYMLEDGALPHQVDDAMKAYGFAMGLFEMQDLAGLDIGYAMRKRQAATRDPNQRYVDIADKLHDQGRLGRKTGAGYYRYADGKTAERDTDVEALIVSESDRKGIARRAMSQEQILQTLLDAMASEGQAVLAEGIAASPEAIDVVMVNGFGFPRWRGGPMFAAGQTS